MLDRVLRFKHHLRAEVAGDDQVFLLSDEGQFLLRGRAYALVAPFVDGTRSVGEILAALADVAPAPEIYFALQNLEARGYVAPVEALRATDLDARAVGFWHALGSDPAVVAARLAAAPVELRALGGADAGLVREALVEAGLRLAGAADEPASVQGVGVDDYLEP
ncbi:MAG TPA: hypothetical protein VHE35_26890, partial [Kofleriaceae bacterium]|nr:hypothetical protein [Kofleriaceae bacterium]